MSNLNFPSSPANNDLYVTANGTWRWDNVSLSWMSEGFGTGSNTFVYFNDSGLTNALAGFTYNKASNTVFVGNVATWGNSTVNAYINSVMGCWQNSTSNVKIWSKYFTISTHTANTTPSVPSGNVVSVFAKDVANRRMLAQIGPSGIDYTFQPIIARNRIVLTQGTGGAAFNTVGATATNTQAAVARAPASGNLFLSTLRSGVATNTTANNFGEYRPTGAILPYWRGDAAGLGGFTMIVRFGLAVLSTNVTYFVGLRAATALMTWVAGPSAQTNIIGFGVARAGTNVFAISANNTVANTIDLGNTIAPGRSANATLFEGVIFAPPNGGTVSYMLTNLTTGTFVQGDYNQTNLPSTTTFLQPKVTVGNGGDGTAVGVDLISLYMETDT